MLHIVIRTHGWWHVRTGPRIWYIIDYLNHIKKNNCLTDEKWADTTKMYRTSYDKLIINHMVKNAFGRGETSKGCTKIFTINLWFNKFKEIIKIK